MTDKTDVTTATAPERIWLQVDTGYSGDARSEPFPDPYDGVTWHSEEIGGLEVEYVRADELTRLRAEVASKDMENAHLRVTAQKVGCPYGHRDPETGACVLGYPGCSCMDDIMATAAWSPEDEEKAAVRLGARVRDLEAEVSRLEAVKDAAVKDAERYRFIRRNPNWLGYEPAYSANSVDADIDTAMRGDREDG